MTQWTHDDVFQLSNMCNQTIGMSGHYLRSKLMSNLALKMMKNSQEFNAPLQEWQQKAS